MTRPNFNSCTFEGTVYKIFPHSKKAGQDVNTRLWTIVLETLPQKDVEPMRLMFSTRQSGIPYLIDAGRIGKGFHMTVTGNLSSVTAGNSHNENRDTVNLRNVHVSENALFFQPEVIWTKTEDGQYVTG